MTIHDETEVQRLREERDQAIRERDEALARLSCVRTLVASGIMPLPVPDCVAKTGVCCCESDPHQECHCNSVDDYACVCGSAVPCGDPDCRGHQLADILGVKS